MKNNCQILLLVLLFPIILFGQEKDKNTQDSIIISDTIKNKQKYDDFYDSLRLFASKNRITKTAFDLVLKKKKTIGKFSGVSKQKTDAYYEIYNGKRIRNIHIVRLDAFGKSLRTTSNEWLKNFGNKTHIKTREFVIKNSLFFKKGDSVDPTQLIDNEILLRSLDYIKDASIEIAEVNENPNVVDVIVIVNDLFSLGVYLDFFGNNSGRFELYENNIAGIGHRIFGSLRWDASKSNPIGHGFKYKIENIRKTFIRADFEYLNSFESEKYMINLSRKFISYKTKWAGELTEEKIITVKDIKKTDTVLKDVSLSYFTNDLWLARAFLLKTNNFQYQRRTRLVVGARYIYDYFFRGPEVKERYNFDYHNNEIIMTSIAWARQKYYKSNFIYAYGKTEDIPIGTILQLNLGIEDDEFFSRFYWGVKFAQGIYYPNIGYFSVLSELGGFAYKGKFEQGAFNLKTNVITKLAYVGKMKIRSFVSLNYKYGIKRFPDEFISLNNDDIFGFSKSNLTGVKKLSLNTELVAFSNINIYNFRFLFFGFADLALIGPRNKSIFNQKVYGGIGLGFRVRNDNFVFKAFQFKFGFYPSFPGTIDQLYYNLSGEDSRQFINFEPTAPSIITY